MVGKWECRWRVELGIGGNGNKKREREGMGTIIVIFAQLWHWRSVAQPIKIWLVGPQNVSARAVRE